MNEKQNKSNNNNGFTVITGSEADFYVPEPTNFIIDTLLVEGFKTVLAGTTGSNKSYFALQEGMSIANGEETFLGFKILQPGLKVLYVDTEVGETELVRRYHRVKSNFPNWHGAEKFVMMSKNGINEEFWSALNKQIIKFMPDIVYIDCLYNAITHKDLTKNVNVFKFTDIVTKLQSDFNLTVRIIHHFNKGGHELGLTMDRMSGASALQNWAEHLTLLTYTNVPALRLLRIVKSRGTDYPREYYGIEWDAESFMLNRLGIVMNWMKYLVDMNKTEKWAKALQYMGKSFTTNDWVKTVSYKLHTVKERQAKNWLNEMSACGVIKKVKMGFWEKTDIEIVDDIIEVE